MEYPGEHKWLTDWLAEEETRSDTFPYSVLLFAWSGDALTTRRLAGSDPCELAPNLLLVICQVLRRTTEGAGRPRLVGTSNLPSGIVDECSARFQDCGRGSGP